ncbi:MAG: phosphatidate cytidylyltransferase [Desulfuromonas sp.]|nr:MAG: phosphatidate cytidylyltransferase [Desulfuromonas sp.]
MKQRILSALVALPILVVFLLYAGQTLFGCVLSLIAMLALHEFYGMGLPPHCRFEAWCGSLAGVAMTLAILYAAGPFSLLAGIVFPVLGLSVLFLFRFKNLQQVGHDLAVILLGLAYIPLLLVHAGLLRHLESGRNWVFLVLVIVMVSDSLAYFVGRKWGRRKLYPAVSPNKSQEGAVGGLVGGLLGALLFKLSFFPALGWLDIVLLGTGIGIFSQVGDLVESLFKRSFGVKDSGSLIPGHGGILDRLDSLLFAFPPAFYYATWFY